MDAWFEKNGKQLGFGKLKIKGSTFKGNSSLGAFDILYVRDIIKNATGIDLIKIENKKASKGLVEYISKRLKNNNNLKENNNDLIKMFDMASKRNMELKIE